MKKAFVTVSGMDYYSGNKFFQPGMEVEVTLKKEPDNDFDKEAILVWTEGLGEIGHVANSWKTVVDGCFSAGRLYDKIGDTAEGIVRYVVPQGLVVEVNPESLIYMRED